MANLKDVIYLSNEDYETLSSTGTVTIDGTTLTYDENCMYVTPEEFLNYPRVFTGEVCPFSSKLYDLDDHCPFDPSEIGDFEPDNNHIIDPRDLYNAYYTDEDGIIMISVKGLQAAMEVYNIRNESHLICIYGVNDSYNCRVIFKSNSGKFFGAKGLG